MATTGVIAWGVAGRPLPGEPESGDLHAVVPFPDGVLVAAVDGLGHGPEATAAARVAVETLAGHADEPLDTLIRRCHEALRPTRGVAMSVSAFHAPDGTMTWLGIGNVEGRLLRADPSHRPPHESILLRSGVVGWQLPPLRVSRQRVHPGDTLILATDGISNAFIDGPDRGGDPQAMADRILARHARERDDALVLVARYVGGAP